MSSILDRYEAVLIRINDEPFPDRKIDAEIESLVYGFQSMMKDGEVYPSVPRYTGSMDDMLKLTQDLECKWNMDSRQNKIDADLTVKWKDGKVSHLIVNLMSSPNQELRARLMASVMAYESRIKNFSESQ